MYTLDIVTRRELYNIIFSDWLDVEDNCRDASQWLLQAAWPVSDHALNLEVDAMMLIRDICPDLGFNG